jgi:3-hydroxy-3-methylglutaryl CoA synthase
MIYGGSPISMSVSQLDKREEKRNKRKAHVIYGSGVEVDKGCYCMCSIHTRESFDNKEARPTGLTLAA